MKLTALFTACRGRNFLAALSAREGRNYQFDFLRPTHSLFGYFNRLVEQYAKVIQPSKEMLEQLKEKAQEGAKWKTLEIAREYAKWERNKREREQRRQDDQEAERRISFSISLQCFIPKSLIQVHSLRLTGMTMPLFKLLSSQLLMPVLNFRHP